MKFVLNLTNDFRFKANKLLHSSNHLDSKWFHKSHYMKVNVVISGIEKKVHVEQSGKKCCNWQANWCNAIYLVKYAWIKNHAERECQPSSMLCYHNVLC